MGFALLYDAIRFAAAAPFSSGYRGRYRWLLETKHWEDRGVAANDLKRKTFIVPCTGAIFIAVSKVANTSLSIILSTKSGVRPRNVHGKRFGPQRLVDTNRTLNDLVNDSPPIFTFARHPIDRFWSAYSDKIDTSQLRSPVRRGISARLGRAPEDSITPEDVVHYLSITPVTLIDEHFRPQWSCTGVEHLPISFVGKLETIGTDMAELVARGFLTAEQAGKLPHSNKSKIQKGSNNRIFNEELRKLYRKDMELFGYD